MSREEVTDKLKGNHPGVSESQKATFSPERRRDRDAFVSSQSPPPPKRKHRRGGQHVEQQQISKLRQSRRYLSYSAPPGVSWPLGNFLLNYTARRHFWMTLSPPQLCVAQTWRQTRIDQTEALRCSTARCLRDVIRIQSPQCFYVTIKKEGARFLKCQRTYTANWKPRPFLPARWSKTFHLPPLIYYNDYCKNPSRY